MMAIAGYIWIPPTNTPILVKVPSDKHSTLGQAVCWSHSFKRLVAANKEATVPRNTRTAENGGTSGFGTKAFPSAVVGNLAHIIFSYYTEIVNYDCFSQVCLVIVFLLYNGTIAERMYLADLCFG